MSLLNKTVKLSNGKEMPVLGFGTYRIKKSKIIGEAIKTGYRLLDSAEFYENEDIVGEVIQKTKREDLFVTTKLWPSHMGYKKCLDAFKACLKRLNMDYVDLFLVHWPGDDGPDIRTDTWRAMEEIYLSGKSKSIGVSNFTVKHLKHLLENCKIKPMVNQCEMHVFLQQKEFIEFCNSNGIVFQSYSTLLKGGKKLMENSVLVDIAKKYNKTVAQIALNFVLKTLSVPIVPKASTLERMKENCDLDFDLKNEDVEKILKLEENYHCTWDPTDVS